VAVESISRFARNARDLLGLVEKLTQKGVEFISLKEHIDTTTPTGAAQKLRPQPVNAKIFHAHPLRLTGGFRQGAQRAPPSGFGSSPISWQANIPNRYIRLPACLLL